MNGRDKKHQPHDEQENLKRCEIKQLPNCWSGKPFTVSRFSQLFLPFPFFFFSGILICLWKCVRVSSPLAKSHNLASCVLRDSRASFSVHSQSFSVGRDITHTSTNALPFLRPLAFFALRKIRS